MFKRFLIWSSGIPPVQWSRTIYTLLKEGTMGNIHEKLKGNLEQWFRRRYCLKIFLIWSSGGPFVQQGGTICAVLVEGIKRNL